MSTAFTHSQERIRAATAARLRLGLNTDSIILSRIKENPGVSTYQIARSLGCSIGRVDGSISRLQGRGEIYVQYVLREGRMIKELYPKDFVTQQEAEVRLDKELLDSPDKWKNRAHIYALDRITLGIAPSESDEWGTKALAKEDVEVQEGKDNLLIKIPPRLADFYMWKNSASDLAIIGDLALLTLKTKIPIHTPTKEDRAELESVLASRAIIWFSTNLPLAMFLGTLSNKPKLTVQAKQTEPAQGSSVLVAPIARW